VNNINQCVTAARTFNWISCRQSLYRNFQPLCSCYLIWA